MQQNLVVWGDIGTDHKALITIRLDASAQKVIIRAFPEEMVTQELQHQLFTVWKNGGEYTFPEELPVWEVDASGDLVLPDGMRLHKPHLLVNAQRSWHRKLRLEEQFRLLGEKTHLLELELENLQAFSQELWNKARSLWAEIQAARRNDEILWQDMEKLKVRINGIFDGLKAFRRLNKEKDFDESKAVMILLAKKVAECEEKLVYPEEWKGIYEQLRSLQETMRSSALLSRHYHQLNRRISAVFKQLRDYRKADHINHLQQRISGLRKVLKNLDGSSGRDAREYEQQFEKLKHYTRGNLSDEEIADQLGHLKKRSAAKEKKVREVKKTIGSLEKKLEKIKSEPVGAKRQGKKAATKSKSAANRGKAPKKTDGKGSQPAGKDDVQPGSEDSVASPSQQHMADSLPENKAPGEAAPENPPMDIPSNAGEHDEQQE